jgi:hypothetical protein
VSPGRQKSETPGAWFRQRIVDVDRLVGRVVIGPVYCGHLVMSDEERQRIYEEEKARLEARKKLTAPPPAVMWGCSILFLCILIPIIWSLIGVASHGAGAGQRVEERPWQERWEKRGITDPELQRTMQQMYERSSPAERQKFDDEPAEQK